MRKLLILLIVNLLLTANCFAQLYLEPIVGYRNDLDNGGKFKQFNSALQFAYSASKHYEIIFQVQKAWSIPYTSSDKAYTPNLDLPVYTNAKKTIKPSSFAITIGNRFKIIKTPDKRNIISLMLYAGFKSEEIIVDYQYNKNDYTILSPDKTLKRNSVFICFGPEYMRQLKNGRFFVQLNASTPPVKLKKKDDYPSTFTFMVPLSLNIGYSILLNKDHHEEN